MIPSGLAHHDDQDVLDYHRLGIEIQGLEFHRVRFGDRSAPDYLGLAGRVFHSFDENAKTLGTILEGKPIQVNIDYLRGLHESHFRVD